MTNQTPDDRFDKKFYEDFDEFWKTESQHCEQRYLTPDTRGIIKDYIKQFLHSEIDLALEQAAKAVEKMKSHQIGDYINSTEGADVPEKEMMEEELYNKVLTSAADIIRKLKNK